MPSYTAQSAVRVPSPTLRGPVGLRKILGLTLGPVLAGLVAGCAGVNEPPSAMTPPASCIVLSGEDREASGGSAGAGPGRDTRTITLGLARPIDFSRAPVPTNPDESMVFGMAYRTLLHMDCTGRIHPDLASSWESRDEERRWIVTLRSDARFVDGSELTARDVAESWHRTAEAGMSSWTPPPGSSAARPLRVEVLDSRRLELTFRDSRPDAPTVLTAPALAVVGPSGERSRPPDVGLPVVQLRPDPGADPRDLLGAGVDVVVTDDVLTLEYVRLRSDLVSRPLPWSRRYVVLFPSARAARGATPPPDSFLEDLAGDAVRVDARPAVGDACLLADPRSAASPFGRSGAPDRTGQDGAVPDGSPPERTAPGDRGADDRTDPQRIGYETNDPTARALAERLVALATAPGGSREARTRTVRAMLGLADVPSRLVAAPESGAFEAGEIARVTSVPRRPDSACRTDGDPAAAVPMAVPLVETRQTLIVRSPAVPVAVDGSGAPYFFVRGS